MLDPCRLCQIEIQVFDLERSLRFYADAFGWRRVPADMHEYTVLEVPRDCPFGISLILNSSLTTSAQTTSRSGHMVLYFGVDDPEELSAKVVAAGGTRLFGPRKIGGYGEVYQVTDPDGLRFGLYKKRDLPLPAR